MTKGKKAEACPALSEIRSALVSGIDEIFRERMDGYMARVLHGNLYKELAMELKEGLDGLYQTMASFKKTLGTVHKAGYEGNMAIQEASDQLESILRATESATVQIMDAAEAAQHRHTQMLELLEEMDQEREQVAKLKRLIEEAGGDCLNIITACSFQDITGQRVKKVVDAIRTVDAKLTELMVTSGVKLKGVKEGKDRGELEEEAKRAVDMLKGPQDGSSQEDVDGLLAELGL